MSITPDALYMSFSRVSNNTCTSNDGAAEGGGIWLNGGGQVMHSTIEGNSAMSQTVHSLEYNAGGGIYVQRSGMLAEDGEVRRNTLIVAPPARAFSNTLFITPPLRHSRVFRRRTVSSSFETSHSTRTRSSPADTAAPSSPRAAPSSTST